MYQPLPHREDRIEAHWDLIRANPLGLLVTLGESGLAANPLPFVLDPSAGRRGALRGHLARANPQWRDFDPSCEALTVFQGPQSYVTPSWYPSKAAHGKVVPTWNYVTVHVYGFISVIEDPAWLASQIRALTDMMEKDRAEPWSVADAPADFIDSMIRQVVGIEILIERVEGKWKLSQNRPPADRRGVAAGLLASKGEQQNAMAKLFPDGTLE